MTKSFVLDASAAISWFLEDEKDKVSSAIDLLGEGRAIVPSIWTWEIANALLVAERRIRLPNWESASILRKLLALPIDFEQKVEGETLLSILLISREFDLSVYDGAYLEVALRRQVPLATIDARLQKAAKKSGVEVIY